MIPAESIPSSAQPPRVGGERTDLLVGICLRTRSLASRALLAILLAAAAALVPGAATRALDGPVTWSDVLGTRARPAAAPAPAPQPVSA